MTGLKGGAREYIADKTSVDSDGSLDLHIGTVSQSPTGGYENEGFQPSAAVSLATLNTQQSADSRKQLYGVDENEDRGNWTGRFDFLLSLLGYAVGLGNVWRFPYLCYRNGGGAFLIPFAIMMVIVGVPLFFMEASIGQFASSGPMTCWKFAPLFKGVGISMVMVSAMTAIYYNTVLAWSFYYMFASFTSELPWSNCNNDWNGVYCRDKLPLMDCTAGTQIKYPNGTCYSDGQLVGVWNDTVFENKTGISRVSPAEEYWNNEALKMSTGMDVYGQPIWYLVLCLMLAWIVVFFCLIKGIKSTGKVVYFTAIFPYIVLVILFFRGVTLENAGEGIKFFIIPRWERLGDARVWKDAAVQIFFSMSIAGGGLITLSSYNRFHNNILKDTVIVCLGDFFTCIFAGFVIFSYLGFMAGKQSTTVDKVAQDGAGLAFVVYPEAVTNLPAPPLWSILFFFMLITLGLDSQFAMVETVLTGCMDQVPRLRKYKTFVIAVICCIFFLLGLPLTCPGGMYLLQLMDNYVGGWTLLMIGFAENIAIAFCYGLTRFYRDLEVMLGWRQSVWWKICWYGLSPIAVMFIFVFTFVDYEPSTYGKYQYPGWADAVGWILACVVIAPIFIGMGYRLYEEEDIHNPVEKLKYLITPTRDWGPALPKHRKLIDYVDGWVVDPMAEKMACVYTNRAFTSKADLQSMGRKSSMDVQNKVNTIYTIDHSIGTPSLPSIDSSNRNLSSIHSVPSLAAVSTASSHVTLESQV